MAMIRTDAIRYERILHGSPLRRRAVAITVAFLLGIVLLIVTHVWLDFVGGLRPDIAAVFFTALGLASLMSIVPLTILWFLDRRERESPWLFAAAFLWGAFIATGLALPANNAIFKAVGAWVALHPAIEETLGPEATIMLVAPVAGPLVEEVTKGIGLVVIFLLLRAEFDNMRDGFVYGALVGLGFTWFEAPLYIAQGYAESGTPPWGLHLGWRYALFGLSGHALFTGLFGVFLGLAMQTRKPWLRMLAPIAGLLLAIAAHVLNNILPLLFALESARAGEPPATATEAPPDLSVLQAWLAGSAASLVLFLPFVVTLAIMLWRSGRWEREVIREELAEEVGRTVSEPEYEEIRADRMFRTRRIRSGDRRHSAALVEAQHELAFRKRRVRDAGHDPERDALVLGWRAEIERLRG
jgi:RsiW-degrading membrane proteinase PrsW (M82 family)